MTVRSRLPGPGAAPWALAFVVLWAVAWVLLHGGPNNYDLEYHLAWGEQLLHGDEPEVTLGSAPTQHPLTILLSTLVAPLHYGGARLVFHLLSAGALAGLAVAAAAIASRLSGLLAALVSVVILATVPAMATTTVVAFQDVLAVALVLVAVLAELDRPRRGGVPLALLAVAGLLRPEAWGLSLAELAWCLSARPGRDRALGLAALAAAAPVAWMATDLLLAGDPLKSFTRTREGAAEAKRTTGLAETPSQLLDNLRSTISGPVILAGAAGAALLAGGPPRWAMRTPPSRTTAGIVLVSLVLACAAFAVIGAGELSLLERYVFLPGSLLVVLAALAMTGWTRAASRRVAIGWGAAALVLAASAAHSMPDRLNSTRDSVRKLRVETTVQDDLRRLVDAPASRAAVRRCGALTVTSYRTRPYAANGLGVAPERVRLATSPAELGSRAAILAPASVRARDILELLGRSGGPLPPAPPGAVQAARSPDWRVLTLGC